MLGLVSRSEKRRVAMERLNEENDEARARKEGEREREKGKYENVALDGERKSEKRVLRTRAYSKSTIVL